MSPEKFAAERLGWWGDPAAATSTAFGPGAWEACADEDAPLVVSAIGVAVSFDRTKASIGAAGLLENGSAVVGAVERRDGVGWLLSEVARIQSERHCAVVIDSRGPASDLIAPLEALRVKVTTVTTNEVLDACASMFDRVQNHTLIHPRHNELDGAVGVAAKRNVGDRWAWGRKQSSGDVSMLEAVTLALWGTATKSRSKYEDADMVVV